MAQQHVPIYKEVGKTYHADLCEPLIEAVEKGELELAALGRGTYPGERIQEQVLPGLQSVGYWDAKVGQQWGLPRHRNEGIELSLLETGSMPFSVDGNLSPMQYLNRVRAEAAAELLKTDKKIIDIAMECGFSTSQYFATAF
jgi:hypothetical protein